ncbi:hypothetical protein ALI144C_05975 [Actinosynnema sp. ALI-1.44]|uniref:helix-turn-helix domain-containing protein n=1 Tax=Actinosynnema sp. ALI-1.44 TaxID=1933779 RepID=UPI00097BC785|nr:helix-turn-helix domain-containing protein [Actinosynnema sp. ALI-1.44]ONI88719.1 hypothetical protein ALI144C_05975 [Actinosynnema sp. ALI-1.44]
MSGLFTLLRSRVDRNAKRAIEVYTEQLPEYRAMAGNAPTRAELVDFATVLRRRTAELAADGEPFTESDLAGMRAHGMSRGMSGVSLTSQQRVLVLHATLTLREIQEATGPTDSDQLTHMLAWLPRNGLAAQNAFTDGYLNGLERRVPEVRRVQGFARALLTGNPAAPDVAVSLGMPFVTRYVVVVVRIPDASLPDAGQRRDEIIEEILVDHRVPMTWHDPGELVALLPADDTGPALRLVRRFAELLGRPCAVAAATGALGDLAAALASARGLSQVAPVEAKPLRLNVMTDLFTELGVRQMPEIDGWLRDLGDRLATGPDLVRTLDCFYRNGMNRLTAAAVLHIHPRTLDYRLRRVRELTTMDPLSVRGIRILSTTVTLVLSGTWS